MDHNPADSPSSLTPPLAVEVVDGIPVFAAPVYFDKDVGEQFQKQVTELFNIGHSAFIIDFQGCKVINSLGISSLMEQALKCEDDYRKKLVAVNLDRAKISVLKLVGVIPILLVAETLADALFQAKSPS